MTERKRKKVEPREGTGTTEPVKPVKQKSEGDKNDNNA